ncbi:MAG: HAMP domain-containing histidine kinase [Myxococcota bacterium]|nr:HAMP domain-containing histidine kinase [Myxococcota bacterium]
MAHVRLLFGIALIAFVAFFVAARRAAIDPDVHEHYATDVARLQTLDHRLNEDVMRARSGLIANYDPLVRTMAEIVLVHARLARVPEFLDDAARESIARAVAASSEGLARQSTLLEQFKSENAILLNSLRFLPLAAEDLTRRAVDPLVIPAVDALVRDVLMLNLWNESALLMRITRELEVLAAVPGIAEDELELVRLHTQVVVARRPRVEALLAELFTTQAARHASALDDLYRVHHAVAARRSSRDEIVLFVLALTIVVCFAALIILRLRRSAGELQHTSDQLALAVDTKNRFVSMTSHEFRTPLSVILSSTELVEAYGDRWSEEKKREHFVRIRGAVQNMTQLIDGVLLIGRGDAGVLDFKPAPTDLDRICRDVIAAVQVKTGAARAIDYEGPERADVVVDERLIRHVLDNLLSNALKYSPEGGRVGLVARCDGREVTLTVSDEGLGIPEEDRARIFESFRRGANVGAIPGTGLGLAVVRRAVDLHRGTVVVHSVPEEGSRFVVTIPIGGAT